MIPWGKHLLTLDILSIKGEIVWRSTDILSKSPKNLISSKGFETGLD
jgi:hypothetical protein